jgi:hypothetical protein
VKARGYLTYPRASKGTEERGLRLRALMDKGSGGRALSKLSGPPMPNGLSGRAPHDGGLQRFAGRDSLEAALPARGPVSAPVPTRPPREALYRELPDCTPKHDHDPLHEHRTLGGVVRTAAVTGVAALTSNDQQHTVTPLLLAVQQRAFATH